MTRQDLAQAKVEQTNGMRMAQQGSSGQDSGQANAEAQAVHLFDPAPAYRLFLGREPHIPPALPDVHALHRFLQKSREFQRSPRARKTALDWPLAQVFVSRPAKVIYCPIGKNACTFLKTEVARSAGLPQFNEIARDIHFTTDYICTGLQLSDYPPERAKRLMTAPQFFKFAVLRDPFDRLLSAYIEKFVMGRLQPANIHHTKSIVVPVQRAAGLSTPDFDQGITFRQFIEFVSKANAAKLDPHWRPQICYLQGINYTRLFRIDQLDEVMDILEERSGVALSRQARNVTGSGKGTHVKKAMDLLPAEIAAAPRIVRDSFFDDTLRAIVRHVYADDFACLEQT